MFPAEADERRVVAAVGRAIADVTGNARCRATLRLLPLVKVDLVEILIQSDDRSRIRRAGFQINALTRSASHADAIAAGARRCGDPEPNLILPIRQDSIRGTQLLRQKHEEVIRSVVAGDPETSPGDAELRGQGTNAGVHLY